MNHWPVVYRAPPKYTMTSVPMTKSKLNKLDHSSEPGENTTRLLELENRLKELEAENKILKSALPSAIEKEIKEFGKSDYKRLVGMDSDDVKRIRPVSDSHLLEMKKILNDMCRHNKICLMDKESGIAFEASGVVGFDGDKLVLFNER